MYVISHFIDLDIMSYASRDIVYHTCAPCVKCNDLGGALAKCVQRHLRPLIVSNAHI
jgi:hypothetical protein